MAWPVPGASRHRAGQTAFSFETAETAVHFRAIVRLTLCRTQVSPRPMAQLLCVLPNRLSPRESCAAGKYGGRGGAGRASADHSRVVVVGGGWQPISAAGICSRGVCYGAPPSPCVPPLLPGTFDLLAGQGALRQPTPSTRLNLCAARSYRCVPYFAPLWVADRQAAAARFARARRSAPRRFAWRS